MDQTTARLRMPLNSTAYLYPGLPRNHSVANIAAEHMGFTLAELKASSKARPRELVLARQVVMVMELKYGKNDERRPHSLRTAGELLGKDHATVLHAKKTLRNLRDTDRQLDQKIQELEIRILQLKRAGMIV